MIFCSGLGEYGAHQFRTAAHQAPVPDDVAAQPAPALQDVSAQPVLALTDVIDLDAEDEVEVAPVAKAKPSAKHQQPFSCFKVPPQSIYAFRVVTLGISEKSLGSNNVDF